MPSVPSVAGLRERVRGWLHREPKPVVPRTILIVDSNVTNRRTTARLVETLGFAAVQSGGLEDALKHLEGQDPDFLLLAFDLDDTTGLDALPKIRELAPELTVIMLAPDVWDSRAAEAMRKGAVAYIARPFGLDNLREVLGRR